MSTSSDDTIVAADAPTGGALVMRSDGAVLLSRQFASAEEAEAYAVYAVSEGFYVE
jgi:hypothetical protein